MLNRPGHQSTASIVAEIEDTSKWKEGKDKDGEDLNGNKFRIYGSAAPDYIFQISDCDRSISFDIEIGSRSSRANTLYKLDAMIDTLTKFREGIVEECKLFDERKKKYK